MNEVKYEDTLPLQANPPEHPTYDETVSIEESDAPSDDIDYLGLAKKGFEKTVTRPLKTAGESLLTVGKMALNVPQEIAWAFKPEGIPRMLPPKPEVPSALKPGMQFEKDIPGVDYTLPPQDPFMSYVSPPYGSESGVQPPPAFDPALAISTQIGEMAARASPLPISTQALREEIPTDHISPTNEAMSQLWGFLLAAPAAKRAIASILPNKESLQTAIAFGGLRFSQEMTDRMSQGQPFEEALDESFNAGLSDAYLFGGGEKIARVAKAKIDARKAAQIPEGYAPKTFAMLPEETQAELKSDFGQKGIVVDKKPQPALAYKEPQERMVDYVGKETPQEKAFEAFEKDAGARKPPKALLPAQTLERPVYEETKALTKPPVLGEAKPVGYPEPKPARTLEEIEGVGAKKSIPNIAAVPTGVGLGLAAEELPEDKKAKAKQLAIAVGAPVVLAAAIKSPAARSLLKSQAGQEIIEEAKHLTRWVKEIAKGEAVRGSSIRGFEATPTKLGKTLKRTFKRPFEAYPKGELTKGIPSIRDELRGLSDISQEYFERVSKVPDKLKPLIEKITKSELAGTEPQVQEWIQKDAHFKSAVDTAREYRLRNTYAQDQQIALGLLTEQKALEYRTGLGSTHIKDIYTTKRATQGVGRKAANVVRRIFGKDPNIPEAWKEEHRLPIEIRAPLSLLEDAKRIHAAKFLDLVKSDKRVLLSEEGLELAKNKYGKSFDKLNSISVQLPGETGEMTFKKLSGIDPKSMPEGMKKTLNEVFGTRGLQGQWVYEDVANDIERTILAPKELDSAFEQAKKLYQTGRDFWKIEKAVMNTANLIANQLYNEFAVEMATKKSFWSPYMVKLRADAFKDTWYKTGESFRKAQRAGLFTTHELTSEMNEYLSLLGKEDLSTMEKMTNAIAKVNQKVGSVYGWQENLYKKVLFDHGLQTGMTTEEAVRFAQKHLFDYSDVSKAIQFMRRFPGMTPFITFPTKALPRVVEYAMSGGGYGMDAVRFWKYPAMLAGWQEYAIQKYNITEQEIKDTRAALKPHQKLSIIVGRDEKTKKPLVLGLSNFVPFLEVVGLGGQSLSDVAMSAFGGPEKTLFYLFQGKDSFGRDLLRAQDKTWDAKVNRFVGAAARSFGPQTLTHILNVLKARKNPDKDPKKEALKMLSVYLYSPSDEDIQWAKVGPSLKAKKDMMKIMRAKDIDSEEKQRQVEATKNQLDEIAEEMDDDTLDILLHRLMKTRNIKPDKE